MTPSLRQQKCFLKALIQFSSGPFCEDAGREIQKRLEWPITLTTANSIFDGLTTVPKHPLQPHYKLQFTEETFEGKGVHVCHSPLPPYSKSNFNYFTADTRERVGFS